MIGLLIYPVHTPEEAEAVVKGVQGMFRFNPKQQQENPVEPPVFIGFDPGDEPDAGLTFSVTRKKDGTIKDIEIEEEGA